MVDVDTRCPCVRHRRGDERSVSSSSCLRSARWRPGLPVRWELALTVQMIIFVVVAVALLFVVRPFLKGRVERSTPDVPNECGRV